MNSSEGTEPPSSSLALALAGFAVSQATEGSLLPAAPKRGARQGRLAAVTCAAVSPLVRHAQLLGAQAVAARSAEEFQNCVGRLEEACLALRSTMGLNGRLPEAEEAGVWELSTRLWVGAAGSCASPCRPLQGCMHPVSSSWHAALFRLASASQ